MGGRFLPRREPILPRRKDSFVARKKHSFLPREEGHGHPTRTVDAHARACPCMQRLDRPRGLKCADRPRDREHMGTIMESHYHIGLILKGERIVIPQSMEEMILEKIHRAPQGQEKCKLRAKDCVYWINVTKDIEEIVKTCDICQEYQRHQTKKR